MTLLIMAMSKKLLRGTRKHVQIHLELDLLLRLMLKYSLILLYLIDIESINLINHLSVSFVQESMTTLVGCKSFFIIMPPCLSVFLTLASIVAILSKHQSMLTSLLFRIMLLRY